MTSDFEHEFVGDEDFDITAVYILGRGEFDLGSPEMTEKIRLAFEKGIKVARRKHKEAGVPMVVSRNGNIEYIQPDEIELD